MAKAPCPILDILPARPTIRVLDIGAMSLGEAHDVHAPLVGLGIAEVLSKPLVERDIARALAGALNGHPRGKP